VNGGRSFLLTNASFMWERCFQIRKEKKKRLHSLKGYNIYKHGCDKGILHICEL